MITRDDELLTVAEAARLLRVSQPTVRRWVREGRIKCVRPGPRTLRLRSRDVLQASVRLGVPRMATSTAEIKPLSSAAWDRFLAQVRELDERILGYRNGEPLPDSVPIIRAARDSGYEDHA